MSAERKRSDGEQTGSVTPTPFPHPWFDRAEPTVKLPYVGMSRQEALSAADANGVAQVRVMEVPIPPYTAFMADLRPNRLNLMIVEGQVVRAAFF